MKYRPRTGATETFSVSVDKETKRLLKARADRLYHGNMSALVAALGKQAERADAVERLIARAGGSTLTDAVRREIDRELESGWKRARRYRASAGRSKKERAA
jgi:hypothetical protein